jgi:hypothetical protein
MKRYFITGIFFLFFVAAIKGQTTESVGNLIFIDTLNLSPLHDWITIENPDSSIWEIGQPDKLFFNSAYSGEKAIVTDSTHFYSDSCNDYFYITIPWEEHFWGEGILSFFHKFDTDTLTDGGIIEVSYDDGESWKNILDDKDHISTNFIGIYNDTIMGSEYGFSGRSDGWQYVELYWWWAALTSGKNAQIERLAKPLIRFRFVSDSINTQKEGWMIDDIVFRGYDVGGAISEQIRQSIEIFPNPSNGIIHVKYENINTNDLNFTVYNLSGQLMLKDKISNNQIDISSLKNGIYIYKIEKDGITVNSGRLTKY